MQATKSNQRILVMAASGKTGRRVAAGLEEQGYDVRRGSRSAAIPFDWHDPTTWAAALDGVTAAYVVYTPDLAVPAAPAAIRAFTQLAIEKGVRRLVLLSGRGEPEAQRCEQIVQDCGLEWTVVRAGWFNQNFTEGEFVHMVREGVVALPVGPIGEAFVDADDIADVAVAALTEPAHNGQVYEVTGPRLLTLGEAVSIIAEASGRDVQFVSITPQQFVDGALAQGMDKELVDLLHYLMVEVLDGRNAKLGDGVQRALGREPRDFADFAREAAATNVWKGEVTV